jgi:hypothetical protein
MLLLSLVCYAQNLHLDKDFEEPPAIDYIIVILR